MKVVFASYYNQFEYNSPEAWLEKIKTFAALVEKVGTMAEVTYIKPNNCESKFFRNGVNYFFLKSNMKKPWFPWRMNKIIKGLSTDVVIVSGIRSPLQILQLKWRLGKNIRIIGRHHHDRPPIGIRRMFQRWADKCFDAYFFTSVGNAQEWIDAGIIPKDKQIYELVEASTGLSRMDKQQAIKITGIAGQPNFLWVGRLNRTKDPLTVLKGFEKYLIAEPSAKLYMMFDAEDLLNEVNDIIKQHPALSKSVILKGKINNNELAAWYSAADFYISGSYSEGGSYALLEAMACGCIPIVTAIPATLKMTGDGKYAVIFQPGDVEDLANKLLNLSLIDKAALSVSVEDYFRKELSNTAIAEKLFGYCNALPGK